MYNAGIIFTSKYNVLGCITRKRKKRFSKETFYISGFGGGGIKGETPIITAIRETIEEIYEFIEIPKNPEIYKNSKNFIQLKRKFKIPEDLINCIARKIKPIFLSFEDNYYLYMCNYGNLIKLMRIINRYFLKNKNIISTIYGNKLPKTIYELLTMKRYDFYKSNEIVKIIRLPYRNNFIIDKFFRKDINKVISYFIF
jgi:hypothetical protein